MGLDAIVRCRCLEDGLPVPERFAGRVSVDEDENTVLDTDWGSDEEHAFDVWLDTCCPHEGMNLVRRRIGNRYGVQLFREALRDNDANARFATLIAGVPSGNGGLTSPADAARMLVELDRLEHLDGLAERHVLLDAGTDDVVWVHVAGHRGEMILSGREGIRLGVDEHGFFVRSNDDVVLFRSRAFTQLADGAPIGNVHEGEEVTFRDIASGTSFRCRSAIRSRERAPRGDGQPSVDGKGRRVFPDAFRAERRKADADDHAFVIAALRAVCEGSVSTGHPVSWR